MAQRGHPVELQDAGQVAALTLLARALPLQMQYAHAASGLLAFHHTATAANMPQVHLAWHACASHLRSSLPHSHAMHAGCCNACKSGGHQHSSGMLGSSCFSVLWVQKQACSSSSTLTMPVHPCLARGCSLCMLQRSTTCCLLLHCHADLAVPLLLLVSPPLCPAAWFPTRPPVALLPLSASSALRACPLHTTG